MNVDLHWQCANKRLAQLPVGTCRSVCVRARVCFQRLHAWNSSLIGLSKEHIACFPSRSLSFYPHPPTPSAHMLLAQDGNQFTDSNYLCLSASALFTSPSICLLFLPSSPPFFSLRHFSVSHFFGDPMFFSLSWDNEDFLGSYFKCRALNLKKGMHFYLSNRLKAVITAKLSTQ